MLRREFLKKSTYLGTCAIIASQCPAVFGANVKPQPSHSSAIQSSFLGWQGVTDNIDPHFEPWQGELPVQLQGMTFFRNGPGMQERAGQRYSHWFDGDGFVNQFKFSQHGVTHQGKFTQTQKFVEESKAGRFLYNGAGSIITNAKPAKNTQVFNTANTALLPMAGELWAMWEAGTPYRLDQETLATKGQVDFGSELNGVPFSAHPHADTDGTIWNFGDISFTGKPCIVVYQLTAQGGIKRYKLLPLPHHSYIHDFAVTEQYLIFYLPPMLQQLGETYIERFKWQKQLGSRVLVVDKHSLQVVNQMELEAGFVFHFGNSWQQNNELVVNLCLYPDATVMTDVMANIDNNQNRIAHEPAKAAQLRLNLVTNKVSINWAEPYMEFLQFDKRFAAKSSALQYGVGISKNNPHKEFDAITRLNTQSGQSQSYSFGDTAHVEEPLFIAKTNSNREGQGYIINTWLDYGSAKSGVAVFDAEKIGQGPLASMQLPYHLPLGFHGAIV